jgi:glucokinase
MTPRAIGIDVGGSKAALGVVDLASGAVLDRRILPTPPRPETGATFLAAIAAAAQTLRRTWGALPAGLGLCELVTPHGAPASAYRVDWTGLDLSPLAPVRLDADVRAAAVAEAVFGAGRGLAAFVYLNIGTGISHTLVLDGRPYAGARGAALVSANGPVPRLQGPPGAEATGAAWVPEDFAGGGAILDRHAARTGNRLSSPHDVAARAEAGDPDARAVMDLAADVAGHLVAQAVNWLDPQAVVLGGGVGSLSGRYRARLTDAARAGIWNPAARGLPILPAALGPDAGIVGAALAASLSTDRPSGR